MCFFAVLAFIFELTFACKFFEYGENRAMRGYKKMLESFPDLKMFIDDEECHEWGGFNIAGTQAELRGLHVLDLDDTLMAFVGAQRATLSSCATAA